MVSFLFFFSVLREDDLKHLTRQKEKEDSSYPTAFTRLPDITVITTIVNLNLSQNIINGELKLLGSESAGKHKDMATYHKNALLRDSELVLAIYCQRRFQCALVPDLQLAFLVLFSLKAAHLHQLPDHRAIFPLRVPRFGTVKGLNSTFKI